MHVDVSVEMESMKDVVDSSQTSLWRIEAASCQSDEKANDQVVDFSQIIARSRGQMER